MNRREQKDRERRWEAYQDGLLLDRGLTTAAQLGYRNRTAKYLIAYSRKISSLEAEDIVREIDRNKLEPFLEFLNHENIRLVVEFCKDKPVRELKREANQTPLLVFLNEKRRHPGRSEKQ